MLFETKDAHFSRTPVMLNQQARFTQNTPLKPNVDLFNQANDEDQKTEHLALIKKLEEFNLFLQKTDAQ